MTTDLERAAQVCDAEYEARMQEAKRSTEDTLVAVQEYEARTAKRCAAAIRALSPAQPEGWVSVKDRLPEGERPRVLVRLKVLGSIEVAKLREDARGKFWRINDARVTIDSATHWMPLPSPPSPASPEGENTDIWCHTCDSVAPIDYKCSHPGCPIMKRASEVAPPADTVLRFARESGLIPSGQDADGAGWKWLRIVLKNHLPAVEFKLWEQLDAEQRQSAARLQGELAEAQHSRDEYFERLNCATGELLQAHQRRQSAELRLAEREKELAGMREALSHCVSSLDHLMAFKGSRLEETQREGHLLNIKRGRAALSAARQSDAMKGKP